VVLTNILDTIFTPDLKTLATKYICYILPIYNLNQNPSIRPHWKLSIIDDFQSQMVRLRTPLHDPYLVQRIPTALIFSWDSNLNLLHVLLDSTSSNSSFGTSK